MELLLAAARKLFLKRGGADLHKIVNKKEVGSVGASPKYGRSKDFENVD